MTEIKRKVEVKLDEKGKADIKINPDEPAKPSLTKKKTDPAAGKIPAKKTLPLTKKVDTDKDVPAKKTLTPTKKIPAKKVSEKETLVVVKTEPTTAPVVEERKRPTMPADFCLQSENDWNSNEDFYDITSNHCSACAKDMPETAKVCEARSLFLKIEVKAVAAAKKSGTASRITKSGVPTQTKIIDDGLLAKKDQSTIVAELAKAHYGGETEASKALALKRFERHLKSIKDGSYCHADMVKSNIAYLSKTVPTAPTTTAK